jgi:hypothetical protein
MLSSTPQTHKLIDSIRSKLWKGTPPGQKDPYASPVLDEGHISRRQGLEDISTTAVDSDNDGLVSADSSVRDLGEPEPEIVKIETDLKIPPPTTTVARSDEVTDPSYVPAENGEELEEVGGLQDWWEDERNWAASKNFVGFGPREKIQDPAVLEVTARRAVVEALAMGAHGSESALTKRWARGGRPETLAALGVGVDVNEDGSVALTGDVADLAYRLNQTRADEQFAEENESAFISVDEARELLKTWDDSWKRISLDVTSLKFAVCGSSSIFW